MPRQFDIGEDVLLVKKISVRISYSLTLETVVLNSCGLVDLADGSLG